MAEVRLAELGVKPTRYTEEIAQAWAHSLDPEIFNRPLPTVMNSSSSFFEPYVKPGALEINPGFESFTWTPPQTKDMRRLLTVIVTDDTRELPLEDSILYFDTAPFEGTDEDVFHQIDISGLLDAHNEKRSQIKEAGSERGLKPLRISQLKKQIVLVASL